MEQPTVLVVDDEPRVLDALEAVLAVDFRVLRAGGGEAALEILAADAVAVIVSDYRMPGMNGVELLRRSQDVAPDALRIVLTAYTDVDSLMDAVNTGHIYHFVPKPWDPQELALVVRRAAERWLLVHENARLRDELEVAYNALRRDAADARMRPLSLERLVGAQGGLREAVELVGKIGDSTTTVMLRGETGTGKELFARLIHDASARRAGRFVAQNCGALPESLLESELFGHARGAFTGATAERRGLFEEAHGGTILLDEIGETSPATQLRLLRVLQEGEVRRVGESITRKIDVRVIAATNADVEAQVARGTFRQDLYYRLNVFPITLPPLRERSGDIPALAEHFLRVHRERARRAIPMIAPEALSAPRTCPPASGTAARRPRRRR
jgi:two-component system response regulator HupR/HoxA